MFGSHSVCVRPGVFIYFGVGAVCGWIVWLCLCCLSLFLFSVFKEIQHASFFYSYPRGDVKPLEKLFHNIHLAFLEQKSIRQKHIILV